MWKTKDYTPTKYLTDYAGKLTNQAATGVSYSLIMKEPLIFYHSVVFAESRLRRANLLTFYDALPAADL